MSEEQLIFEEFTVDEVLLSGGTAHLWEEGWRHFGGQFFRYNLTLENDQLVHIVPVRIDLSRFVASKSQRRVLRKNSDLQVLWKPAEVNAELEELFHRHKVRFKDNVPNSLLDFVSPNVGTFPCDCEMLLCYEQDVLIAASYCDFDGNASSSIYGMFDPVYSRRGLGLFTLLVETIRAQQEGRKWHYLGYATEESGIYDYKKNFNSLQGYDWWNQQWKTHPFSGKDPQNANICCL